MKAMERRQVTVVDDATRERLERFGVAVLADNGSRSPRRVLTVGDDGIARGSVRAFDAALVHLFGLGVSFTDQPLELVAFERIERTLRRAVGSLELLWPVGLTLPEGAEVRVSLEPITEGTPTQSLNTRVSSEATAPGPSRANLAGATFEQVFAGRSRLNVMVTDQKQRQETKLPNGGTRYSASMLFETTAKVVIAPSERTRLQL